MPQVLSTLGSTMNENRFVSADNFRSADSSSHQHRFSRREFHRSFLQGTTLAGAALAGVTSFLASGIDANPSEDATALTPFSTGLVDAHVHVWTPDTERYPLAKGYSRSSMQPSSFTPKQLMQHARPAGVSRVVLIQMSYYGFDNSYMLNVIQAAPKTYRGVAVIDEESKPVATMKDLKKKGVSGFRIQPKKRDADTWLKTAGMKSMWKTGADQNLAMCHLINPEFLPSVKKMCQQYRETPVVIDHFARIGVDGKIRPRDLDNLCRLAPFKNVTVKISAYYALGKKKAPYKDLAPMIKRVLDEFGADRLMWASDCPFQVVEGHQYAPSINLIKSGLDFLTPESKHSILQKTAERVFFS